MRSRSKRQTCPATGRRTPTDQVRTRRRERPVPESNGESDHSQPADWFPTEGAINPDRQAGVQRKKRSTPIAERVSSGRRTNVKLQPPDLDRGRRAKSTPSFRSVLPAKDQRQTPLQQQFPRGRPGRANHPPDRPVQQGSRTQVSMVGNLGKSLTVLSLSTSRDPQKRACGAPFEDCRQIVHKT